MTVRTFTINVTAPQVGVPTYAQGMADFEVRALPVTTNGNGTTLQAMLPAEWRPPDTPPGSKYILSSWNGGVGDAVNRKLYFTGGGHSNGANNGIHVFDFGGDAAPIGFSTEPGSLSALDQITTDTNTYLDGKPTAIHTYCQLAWDSVRRRVWRYGGSGYGTGSFIPPEFYWDTVAKQWGTLPSRFTPDYGGLLLLSPDAGTFLAIGVSACKFYDAATGAATSYGSAFWLSLGQRDTNPVFTPIDTSNPSAATYLVQLMNEPNGARGLYRLTVNWPAKTWTTQTLTPTGAAASLLGGGASLFYDQARGCFWSWGTITQTRAGAISYMLEINASTFAVTQHSVAVASGLDTSNARGTFNRFVWFPDWRVIGAVYQYNQPAVLIKLPSA